MRLSDISQESFGFDLTEFPVVEDEVEPLSPEPTSPTKARMLGSHKRNRSSTNGAPPGDQTNTNILVQQAQGMLDLEQLILALDALEHFAHVCDKTDKYVKRLQYRGSRTNL